MVLVMHREQVVTAKVDGGVYLGSNQPPHEKPCYNLADQEIREDTHHNTAL